MVNATSLNTFKNVLNKHWKTEHLVTDFKAIIDTKSLKLETWFYTFFRISLPGYSVDNVNHKYRHDA